MHRALQDLGCKCLYLDYSAEEVSRILETIVSNHDTGGEIFGETSEAIIDGDISIASIRDICVTFEQRLGELNIFPTSYHFASRRNEDVYQIDDEVLVRFIEAEAAKRGRAYKRASALTDARSVSVVMRLRKGSVKRDISSCLHLLVSHNPVFQVATKNYVLRDVEEYEPGAIPPVLTLGQVTTFAWLATAKTLEPVKVTKELLATCYNAVRPSASWTQQFSIALESFRVTQPEALEERANAALFLQVARNSARDDSYNQPAVLRKLNIAELFARAASEADAAEQKRQEEISQLRGEHHEVVRKQAEEAAERQAQISKEAQEQIERTAHWAQTQVEENARRYEAEKAAEIAASAVEAATKAAAKQREETLRHQRTLSSLWASYITTSLRVFVSISLGGLLYLLSIDAWETGSTGKKIVSGILAILLTLANLDLVGLSIVKMFFQSLQNKLARWLLGILAGPDAQLENLRPRVEPAVVRRS